MVKLLNRKKEVCSRPMCCIVSAKLHYTDTGYEHRLRTSWTSSQQFYNLLYNKFTANGQKFATSQHLDMPHRNAVASRCGKFVVELLRVCPLVVLYNISVAGVRVVEFGHKQELLCILHSTRVSVSDIKA